MNDLAKYVLVAKPVGHFYARKYSPMSRNNQDVNNTFRFSETMLTIITEDDVDDLKENNVVLFEGHPYVVLNIQRKEHIKEGQFGHDHYTTYSSLRK